MLYFLPGLQSLKWNLTKYYQQVKLLFKNEFHLKIKEQRFKRPSLDIMKYPCEFASVQ